MSMYARPLEKASEKEIEQSRLPGKVVKTAASIAGGTVGLPAIIKKISPFLSKLIPANLAIKGLSKIDPRLVKFFKGITNTGYTVDEGLDFLRDKISASESPESLPEETQGNERIEALKKYNAYKKKRTLMDQVGEDIEQMHPQETAKSELTALTEKGLNILMDLKGK